MAGHTTAGHRMITASSTMQQALRKSPFGSRRQLHRRGQNVPCAIVGRALAAGSFRRNHWSVVGEGPIETGKGVLGYQCQRVQLLCRLHAAQQDCSRQPQGDARHRAELNENDSIHEAAEASFKRLQTDVMDLYQLHWPDRYRPSIGALCCDPWKERESVPSEETVAAIKELIDSGRIRIWGSSNETTFGVSECQSC